MLAHIQDTVVFCPKPYRYELLFLMMATNSLNYHRHFLKSADARFKIILLVIGFSSWCLIYLGDVLSNSYELPSANREAQLAAWSLLPCWLLTLASFVTLSYVSPSKWALKIDALLNMCFAVLIGFATIFCSSVRDFIWVCDSLNYTVVLRKYCDPPNTYILRNSGTNIALMLLMSVLCTVYLTHFIFVITKLCTEKLLPKSFEFIPVSS